MQEQVFVDGGGKVLRTWDGKFVLIADGQGGMRKGRIRIKKVKCGKPGCTKCPHSEYAYVRYRYGKRVIEKYIGVVK